jgi:tetratricopeptide (TPR) repeat protein
VPVTLNLRHLAGKSAFPNGIGDIPNAKRDVPNQKWELPNRIWDVPNRKWGLPNAIGELPNQIWELPNEKWDVPGRIWDVPNPVWEGAKRPADGPGGCREWAEVVQWRQHAMSICTLCKTQIPETEGESWTTPKGEVIKVARNTLAAAVAETSLGEFEICESCYLRGLPAFFTPQDAAEIHYQFGLEYRDHGQLEQSVESLTQARRISETADIVAALAHTEDKRGHRELAITLYQRALEIDPTHFMSQQNLQRLNENAA